ncbi:MAG: trans-sulfuration enzyme family protein [Hyphomicrobiaceae bacterium]
MTDTHLPADASAESFAVQGGGGHDSATGAVLPAVHLSTTYLRDKDNAYSSGYSYRRDDNPNVRQAEAVLQRLENARGPALLYSSGMSAAISLFLALPSPARVIAPEVMYWGLRQWLRLDGPRHGIATTFVDYADPEKVDAALTETKPHLVWIETPGNPMWNITDIRSISEKAHAAGALVGCDSTVATPVLTRPLDLGADVVMHSASKYLNGHSDVIAGALVFAEEGDLAGETARNRRAMGPILSPLEAMLLLRGMRTLHLRVRHHCEQALKIAHHFDGHARVAEVLYPGLPGRPGHNVAANQMTGGFGGMMSIRVKGGAAAATATAANVKVWTRATSLGGVESLIEHRASIEGPGTPVPDDLLRLSVGIERADDLIADLEQALEARAA